MLKIESTVTPSAEWLSAVVMGCRNPYDSWVKSDSSFDESVNIGQNDMKLMMSLSLAGDDHGKFMRMIPVICDITAPLYWWKEMDQYKVGTVTDSCSTMHTITKREFTIDNFACEHLSNNSKRHFLLTIEILNQLRDRYLMAVERKDPQAHLIWYQLIQMLPSSYIQKRTWSGNYQVLKHIYHARKGHKLKEWETVREWIDSLPLSELITGKAAE